MGSTVKHVEPATLFERASAFYSYTAGSHAVASTHFSQEEFELVDAAQTEIALQKPPKTKLKNRQVQLTATAVVLTIPSSHFEQHVWPKHAFSSS
jgi:hypothetical protein